MAVVSVVPTTFVMVELATLVAVPLIARDVAMRAGMIALLFLVWHSDWMLSCAKVASSRNVV